MARQPPPAATAALAAGTAGALQAYQRAGRAGQAAFWGEGADPRRSMLHQIALACR